MESSPLDLSVVIPAYNEQVRLSLTLRRTLDYLAAHHPRSELILVDDGSTDATARIAEDYARRDSRLRVLRQPENRGKGAAVRRGMLEARGAWALFSDADLSTPIEETEKMLFFARDGGDVVIGSRGLKQSEVRRSQPFGREWMGKTFNFLIRQILMADFRDTQCGFKLFRREVAQDIFARQTLDGFAFDVEILKLARDLGYSVKEVPVIWVHAPNSKVSVVSDSSRMLTDLIKLRLKKRLGGDGDRR